MSDAFHMWDQQGRLTVMGTAKRWDDLGRLKERQTNVFAVCACGNAVFIPVARLRGQNQQSCGCLHVGSTRKKDMTGQKFGMLTVLGSAPSDGGGALWRCRCDCGGESVTTGARLRSGNTTSCGCKAVSTRLQPLHGLATTPEYITWRNMMKRCYDPTAREFPYYGGRGIAVCDRWRFGDGTSLGVELFFADVGKRPEGLTIDRIDVNGGYEPGNVRWADKRVQANNRRSNLWVKVFGQHLTMAQLARVMKVNYQKLRYRIVERGMEPEDALRALGVRIPTGDGPAGTPQRIRAGRAVRCQASD